MVVTSCNKSYVDGIWDEYYSGCSVNSWMESYIEGCGGGDKRHFKPIEQLDMTMWRRARTRLEVFADSTATYTLVSPEDPRWTSADQLAWGTWAFDAATMTLLILDEDSQIISSFLVNTVGRDFLYLTCNEAGLNSPPK